MLSLRVLLRAAAAGLGLAAAPAALACSVCAAGDPLVHAGDAASDAREVRLAVEAEWLRARAAMAGMPGMIEELTQSSLRLGAVVSALPRLNVVALLPVVRKETSASGAGADHGHEVRTGIGDAELGARWFLLDRSNFEVMRHHSVALSAGTSFPTGPNDAREGGVRVDEHGQLGTGGFGPYAGALWRVEQSRWHALASVAGRYRTENRFGYRYGPSLAWSLEGQLQPHPRVALGLGLDGREAWADRDRGAAVPDTGGLVLAAAPSVRVGVGGGVWIHVRAQLPVLTRLRGVQEVGPVVVAGVQLRVF